MNKEKKIKSKYEVHQTDQGDSSMVTLFLNLYNLRKPFLYKPRKQNIPTKQRNASISGSFRRRNKQGRLVYRL